MKNIALVAASLALLGTAATAQNAQSSAKTIKVINGSVITLYSVPENETTGKEGYSTICSDKTIYDDRTDESRCEGSVLIQIGKTLKIYADKATFTNSAKSFIVLQSDGRIESNEGDHKVTQFAAEGTRIEML